MSVGTDAVKKTDAKLDPMPEEGGERPGQESSQKTGSKNKQTKINPLLLSVFATQDI